MQAVIGTQSARELAACPRFRGNGELGPVIDFDASPLTAGIRFRARDGAAAAPWSAVIDALTRDASFRKGLTERLASSPFAAFFWECNSVSVATMTRPFEMVLIDGPALTRMAPNTAAFAQHLGRDAPDSIRTFENLGGDAMLVVPTALAEDDAYPHLAAFVRNAPAEQVDALWQRTGEAVSERLASTDAPMWLSTSGLGVAWVHVRLDSRPKYYTHRPFRDPPPA